MRRSERLLVGLSTGAAIAVLVYAIERVVERIFFPEPNPAVLVWSARSSFVWRAAIALYAGGMGTFGGAALAGRSPGAAARWLPAAIAAAALAIVVQAVIVP